VLKDAPPHLGNGDNDVKEVESSFSENSSSGNVLMACFLVAGSFEVRSHVSLDLVAFHFFFEVVETLTSRCYGFFLELEISEDDCSWRVWWLWIPPRLLAAGVRILADDSGSG
ncbi:hypothetical protein A2U01_0041019, partial [Trifolium medium]|nr:hypothetical protein [Trifolium medium]